MAAMIERTTTDDVADALRALEEMERYARDLRAHLETARYQNPPEPGTLAMASRNAGIVAAEIETARAFIRDARLATAAQRTQSLGHAATRETEPHAEQRHR
jgi:hypothetical protein